MAKVLVLYYSLYGHIEVMAKSVAAGVASVIGVQVRIKRVPELMSPNQVALAGGRADTSVPVATIAELPEYDALIFGTPTRFGNMASQMRNFLDQTGALWYQRALIGKIGSVFVSTGTGSGNETTITSFHTTLFHHGMIVVGLPISAPELADISQAKGGSLLGAGCLAGSDASRPPSTHELALARFQGAHVAAITATLARGRLHNDDTAVGSNQPEPSRQPNQNHVGMTRHPTRKE
jgi:NAD(P)H dehydrogenase (quinone)